MADDDAQNEFESVRTMRGREASTVAKWQNDGWDLHTQNQGLMRTDLTFRRVKPKTLGTYLSEFSAQGQAAFRRLEPQTHRRVLAVAGGLILLTVGIGIGAAIQGGDGIAEPTGPPSVAAVVPSEQPSVEPSDEPAEEVSEPSEEPSPDVMPPTTAAPTATESEWVELARFSGASKAYRTERPSPWMAQPGLGMSSTSTPLVAPTSGG